MYYQNYEDYIRSILGYPVSQSGNMNTYENCYMTSDYSSFQTPNYSDEIMDLYPEIYKILNPMVCKICEANTKPIDNDLIERMTEEIYLNIESDPSLAENEIVNVRVNLPKENSKVVSASQSRTTSAVPTASATSSVSSKRLRDNRTEKKENKTERNTEATNSENRESRQFDRNNTLRDLIRILILNRLLGRDIRRPRPRPRPRPPFPGGPGPNPNPNPRPPMRPRNLYSDNQYLTNGF